MRIARTLFNIILVNFLAIICFPLLIISILARLVSVAVTKLPIIAAITLIFFAVAVFFEFIKDPAGGLDILGLIVILFLFLGFVVGIIVVLLAVAAGVFAAAVTVLTYVSEGIHSLSYAGYTSLYRICVNLTDNTNNSFLSGFTVPLFALLRLVNVIVYGIFILGAPISVMVFLGGAVGAYVYFDNLAKRELGISVIRYFALFGRFDLIYGVTLLSILVIGIGIIVITVGIELSSWGIASKHAAEKPLPDGIADMPPGK